MLMKKTHSPAERGCDQAADQEAGCRADSSDPPQIPSALLRSGTSGKMVISRESAVGAMIAAETPWTMRAPIKTVGDQASPARQRRRDEQAEADPEHLPPSEQVGGAATEEQQAEEQQVGAHHPLDAALRKPRSSAIAGRAT